jgi:streptogramin lyase
MRLIKTITLSAAVVAASAAAAAGASAAPAAGAAAAQQYEGTVVSVDRAAKTFRLRDSERGTIRIKVTARTSFERINGLRGLKAGMRNVESTVRRAGGAWVALSVERSGGGGDHGGGNGGGDDHGGDRGRGRGSDD